MPTIPPPLLDNNNDNNDYHHLITTFYTLSLSFFFTKRLTSLLNKHLLSHGYSLHFHTITPFFLLSAKCFSNTKGVIYIPDLFSFLDIVYTRQTLIATYYYLQRIKVIKRISGKKSFIFTSFGNNLLFTIVTYYFSLKSEFASRLQLSDNEDIK